ncbi:molybdopterin-binding oxidoreductase [Rubrobacter taiwanensis]|jgi:DMSO/TMAO reductase YedYZ molybdopterin-dependent catalytic subunit|uniref:Molybdopterin-binding oxidoreductase n=1 Tax=Rubrobacter taiwanensis TaxID=185139 RepID=A0A4V2NX49_9ACTN|nr:sulfite oxidase [Rubrobacter taiwanensis]TCJ19852.1 molybdopterin-binding oxidoreductase [Rubrobacter taiwanensis]
MDLRRRETIAGAAGAGVALGITELARGLSEAVPSFALAVSQRAVELAPGGIATAIIGVLGSSATPLLVSIVVLAALFICARIGELSRRRPGAALAGAGALVAAGIAAALFEPGASPPAVISTGLVALAAGAGVVRLMLRGPAEGDAVPEYRRAAAMNRRRFLALAGGAALLGLSGAAAGRMLSDRRAATAVSAKLPVSPAGVKKLPPPPAGASFAVEGMPPLITPKEDFYLIDTAIYAPRVNAEEWQLKISGAVRNPFALTYRDLLSLPAREVDITIACVSNEVGGGLVSNGRWTGVLLSDILEEAGLRRGELDGASDQLVGRAVDGWTAGFRTGLALDGREALVAYGMNGETLPIEHGYPARLVVPGLYGYVSATKWLSEIELTGWREFDAYWTVRGWAKEGPIKTQSRIDTLTSGDTLPAGPVDVGGVAWAPTRGIERVEVSTDGGNTWDEAELAAELSENTWRQWLYRWEAEPGEHTLQVRATDGTGETQTAERSAPAPAGATGYHTVNVTVEG